MESRTLADIRCIPCDITFKKQKYLKQHEWNKHAIKRTVAKQYVCNICNKSFKKEVYLRKHEKEIHSSGHTEEKKTANSSAYCLELDCNESFLQISSLRSHLSNHHKFKMESEVLNFNDKQEFLLWMQDVEKDDVCTFVNSTGIKKNSDGINRSYYYCNRGGQARKICKEPQRKTKVQGTAKIGHHCTAGIIMRENSDGKIKVTYHKTHYKHAKDLSHLRVSDADKGEIAGKLSVGVTPEAILDNIKNSVDGSFKRLHLITKRDINNITSSYGIKSDVQKNTVDSVRVDIWVKEMATNEKDNVVIIYKPQNNESDIFEKEDFLLAIMSKAQADMLVKLGNNSLVCMDSTHGTNSYGFDLTTLLVKDDRGEGFPVAFFISNRKDYTSLEYFLNAVKEKAGIIHSNYFMSDDADQFFAAWKSVNGGTPQKLLCSWHVDKAWQEKLSTVKDVNIRTETHKTLRILLQEPNVSNFQLMLIKAIQNFRDIPDTKVFGDYFCDNYSDRTKSWAYCYRLSAGIDTNVCLESVHKSLKHIYLHGKVCKRLDKTVHALMKYVRDKQFDSQGMNEEDSYSENRNSVQQCSEKTAPEIEPVSRPNNKLTDVKQNRIVSIMQTTLADLSSVQSIPEMWDAIYPHVTAIQTILAKYSATMQKPIVGKRHGESSNTNIDRKRFFPTKKKRKVQMKKSRIE